MSALSVIHAVVWVDMGAELRLLKRTREEAVSAAKDMERRAIAKGIVLQQLRAVTLDANNRLTVDFGSEFDA